MCHLRLILHPNWTLLSSQNFEVNDHNQFFCVYTMIGLLRFKTIIQIWHNMTRTWKQRTG
jgi:hypothetical protein